MSSIFTKIINREIPAHIVAEDENHIAFLDISPLAKGHTLVVPKKETDYIFNLEAKEYSDLWAFTRMVSKGIDRYTDAKRIGIAVIGLEVPHAHIHLVPINGIGDIDFGKEKLKLSQEELAEIASQIKNNI